MMKYELKTARLSSSISRRCGFGMSSRLKCVILSVKFVGAETLRKIIAMRSRLIQWVGIAWTILYASFVVWTYATAPQSVRDVATGASVAAGTYEVDHARFDAGRALFLREQYAAARDEWARADPARRDAHTQFYVAYAFYRQGWGRVYNDDALFRQGLEAVERAISLSTEAPLEVEDPELKIHSAAELKAELQKGTERSAEDLNPLKVFRERR